MTHEERERKIKEIRDYAKSTNSPLNDEDIGLLISSGQLGTPLEFKYYRDVWEKWIDINDGEIEFV